MSVHVTSWCWRHSKSKGVDRLILVSIADMADDDGENAFPSYSTLAERCGGISVKTVQRSTQRLAELGELAIEVHGGPAREGPTKQRSNRYSFPAYQTYEKCGQSDRSFSPPVTKMKPGQSDRSSGVESQDISGGRPDIFDGRPDTAMSSYPSLDPSLEPSLCEEAATAPTPGPGDGLFEPPEAKPKPTRSRPDTTAPDKFELTLALRGWFRDQGLDKLGVNISYETDQCLDWHRAKGSKHKDWDAVWRRWMRTAGQRARERAGQEGVKRGRTGISATELPADDWRRWVQE